MRKGNEKKSGNQVRREMALYIFISRRPYHPENKPIKNGRAHFERVKGCGKQKRENQLVKLIPGRESRTTKAPSRSSSKATSLACRRRTLQRREAHFCAPVLCKTVKKTRDYVRAGISKKTGSLAGLDTDGDVTVVKGA